jgi:hypothetical protein
MARHLAGWADGLDHEIDIGFAYRLVRAHRDVGPAVAADLNGEPQHHSAQGAVDAQALMHLGRCQADRRQLRLRRGGANQLDARIERLPERRIHAQSAQPQRLRAQRRKPQRQQQCRRHHSPKTLALGHRSSPFFAAAVRI